MLSMMHLSWWFFCLFVFGVIHYFVPNVCFPPGLDEPTQSCQKNQQGGLSRAGRRIMTSWFCMCQPLTDHVASSFLFPIRLSRSEFHLKRLPPPLFSFLGFVFLFARSKPPPVHILLHPSHLSVHLLSSPWLQDGQCFMLSWWPRVKAQAIFNKVEIAQTSDNFAGRRHRGKGSFWTVRMVREMISALEWFWCLIDKNKIIFILK